ncbi:SDR family NAD(P)-dependent oxidoreductase [Deinococcus cellulosilyticus]|uniref:Short-chain dehydrogenase n=1 Tax=Deinococcus cellulosilyticus (strain DSM 18568 / NBRC 106333 / KACC 11606 / 5516J-15) TaxID=1223518 RepID=A0A511N4G1_DEIC1|nr:SDR family NAD(P)-dependent oxidoreductase [Deinococcus cellulosilyticus]GEM47368.1 short-chain dehydrogenase [Deinococcus cellulosilyticus NBRC 106333 = KACC 11606]
MHILITGASSGIGLITAEALLEAGHQVTVAARRYNRFANLQAMYGPEYLLAVKADLRVEAELVNLAREARSMFGPVDVLINNAGVSRGPGWHEDARAMDVLQLNLMAAVRLSQLVLPDMLERKKGHIINIGSVAGHIPVSTLYSASKFGLRGFSLALRRELLGTGVHVSLISPGFVETEMTARRKVPKIPPGKVAELVLRLMQHPRPEVVIPAYYKILIGLEHLFPSLVDRIVRGRQKFETN